MQIIGIGYKKSISVDHYSGPDWRHGDARGLLSSGQRWSVNQKDKYGLLESSSVQETPNPSVKLNEKSI